MFRTNKDELTIEDIEGYITRFRLERDRMQKLKDYYLGKHDILTREDKKDTAPDNRLVNAFPKYITDMHVGYFVGQPILYSANDLKSEEDDALLEKLMEIYKYNDEQEENLELAKMCSIMGKAYELMWVDDDANVRFNYIDPTEMFVIYDMSIEKKILYAVRFYEYDDAGINTRYVEVYDKKTVRYYEGVGGLKLAKETPHYYGDVPVILYENNKEQQGDFEPAMTLIDSYDLSASNTLNDMEQFTDAYLVLVNMLGTDDEDVKKLRDDRVLLIDDNGDAKWLIKDVNDAWVENYKNRTQRDIHKFSYTPDMTDENFGSNLSGVSLSYKLLAMEQLRSNKERKFKKGLQRRIELICNFLKITNKELTYTGIDMQFNNTLPTNVLEMAQIVSTLLPVLSKETLIEQLPFVENAKEEMEKKEAEEDYTEDYSDLIEGHDDHGQEVSE